MVELDEEDFHYLFEYSWYQMPSGYLVRFENNPRKTIFLHKEILKITNEKNIHGDHIDRNKLNNSKSNLRIATHRENSFNRNSKLGVDSKYRCVLYRRDRGVFYARAKNKYGITVALLYDKNIHFCGYAANIGMLHYGKTFAQLNKIEIDIPDETKLKILEKVFIQLNKHYDCDEQEFQHFCKKYKH